MLSERRPVYHKQVDALDYLRRLRKSLPQLFLLTVALGLLAGFAAMCLLPNTYTATARIYVIGAEETGGSRLAELQVGAQLAQDCAAALSTWEVHADIRSRLKMDIDADELGRMLAVEADAGSRIVQITARCADPTLAAEVANAAVDAARDFCTAKFAAAEAFEFSAALPASAPEAKGIPGYALLGALLGATIGATIMFIHCALDMSPRTAEDVTRISGLRVLTVIPYERADAGKQTGVPRQN